MDKKHLWLMIAQTHLLSGPDTRLADQILVELAVVPEDAIPERPEEMWGMIRDYINYAENSWDEAANPPPEWFKDEWVSDDW